MMTANSKFIYVSLAVLLSGSSTLAWCLLPQPPKNGRRTTDQFNAYIPTTFTNDGQHFTQDEPGVSFSSRPCIEAGLTSGWQDAGVSVQMQSYQSGIWIETIGSYNSMAAFTTREPWNWATTGGKIEVPHDISKQSNYNCDRIKKLIRHEVGHVLGLNHPEDGGAIVRLRFPRWIPSIMHEGTTGPYTGIDDLPLNPTCGDIGAAKESKNQEGPSSPDVGDAGGIVYCGPNAWSDAHGCCHEISILAYAPSVGHWNRKPTVAIESPANNSSFVFGSGSIEVHTIDSDGSVNRLDYIVKPVGGSQFVVSGGGYPYTVSTASLTPGSYDVEAVAYDTANEYSVSPAIRITIVPPPSAAEVLASGAALYPNQYRMSANGQYLLLYQTDGNLVLYSLPSWTPLLWTATSGNGATYMNQTGNLEVYNSLNPLALGWQSLTGSPSNYNSYLWVKNDGHVALIRPNGSQVGQWP